MLAFSGGRDSSVLLHALHSLIEAGQLRDYHLQAVHVHHGLHPRADDWAAHCERVAGELGVSLVVERLQLARRPGDEGEEGVAREGRYRALQRRLAPNGRLLTAHHADDQLESMLLALARGAGVQGLAAMGGVQPRGPGWHVRPLLPWPTERVAAYAQAAGLTFVEDPTNHSEAYARSYLRHKVLPVLRARWPTIAASAVRSAAHCADAAAHEHALAQLDADASLKTLERLPFARLADLTPGRQRSLIRAWCRARGHRPPPQRRLECGLTDLLASADDAKPSLMWDGLALRRYRAHLYLVLELDDPPAPGLDDPLALPVGLGRLSVRPVAPGEGKVRISPARWRAAPLSVRYRTGGERLLLPGREGSRTLKHLLQEWGVVPWMRGHLPLLYQGDRMVAVGDLAVTAEYAADTTQAALELRWELRPTLF